MPAYNLNGTSLFALKEGGGEPVVFMHGFGLDHRMWERQQTRLCNHFTLISYDLRGFGRSGLPDMRVPYSHEDDYLALLHHFELESAPIVGLSMGGRLALRCALTCRHAVSSLTLLDSAIDGHVWSSSWQNEWNPIVSTAKEDSLDAVRQLWMRHSLFVQANSHSTLTTQLTAMVEQYSGWHWINKDPAVVSHPLTIQRLGHIAIPALIITGKYDIPDFQQIADTLYREIPNVQRLVVPNAGHLVNMESPDMVNNAILNFLNGVK